MDTNEVIMVIAAMVLQAFVFWVIFGRDND